MPKLSFHQTPAEQMVRIAASLIFRALQKSGCELVPLSTLADDPQYGYTASATDEPVGPQFVRITDLKDGRIEWESVPYCQCPEPKKYLLKKGDILFARTGATTGKTHLVESDADAVFASYLIRVRPRLGIQAQYLHAFFQSDSYWEQIIAEKEGSAQPNVNGGKLMTIRVPATDLPLQQRVVEFLNVVRKRQDGVQIELPLLPPPIEDQRRIVARIEGLSKRLILANRLRRLVESEANAVLPAFLNRLFGNPYRSVAGTLDIKRYERIGDLSDDVADGPHVTPRYVESGVPFVTVLNITSGRVDFGGLKYITPEDHQQYQRRAQAQKGDVLISKDGSIGIPCFVDTDREFSFFVSVALVKPKKGLLDGKFLYWVLRTPHLQERMKERSRGDMICHLVLREIRDLLVPLPPIETQRSIVALIESFHEKLEPLIETQRTCSAEIASVMPSILNQAFSGQL